MQTGMLVGGQLKPTRIVDGKGRCWLALDIRIQGQPERETHRFNHAPRCSRSNPSDKKYLAICSLHWSK